jgi:hypothetical protein
MCDYSLEHVASRPAQVADRLVTTSFSGTITRGFATANDVHTAVCLRPGTEIAFDREVVYEHPVTHRYETIPSRLARFRQVDLETACAHHDALEFASGEIVLLTKLPRGQYASVLQLPARAQTAVDETAKEQPAPIVR